MWFLFVLHGRLPKIFNAILVNQGTISAQESTALADLKIGKGLGRDSEPKYKAQLGEALEAAMNAELDLDDLLPRCCESCHHKKEEAERKQHTADAGQVRSALALCAYHTCVRSTHRTDPFMRSPHTQGCQRNCICGSHLHLPLCRRLRRPSVTLFTTSSASTTRDLAIAGQTF